MDPEPSANDTALETAEDYVSDICDVLEKPHPDITRVAMFGSNSNLRHYGATQRFYGPIQTITGAQGDNSRVKEQLQLPGRRRVLIVDGASRDDVALLGGNLAEAAHRNDWAGIIVLGCVRDCPTLARTPIGILASGHHPRRSIRKGGGQVGASLSFLNQALVHSGDWVYVDETGILLTDAPIRRSHLAERLQQ